MYASPPSQDITIDEFEKLAIGRLQVLRTIEAGLARGFREDELLATIRRAQEKYLPLHSNESSNAFNVELERENDNTSHWLLRLAFASSIESCRWFVNHEHWLLKLRYALSPLKEKAEFVKSIQLPYDYLTAPQKAELYDMLSGSTLHSRSVEAEEFVKVPWTHVTDLVAKRHVLLHKGFAYVPSSDFFSVISSRFRDQLEGEMDRMCRLLLANPIEDRVRTLLDHIRNSEHEAPQKQVKFDELSAGDIEASSSHFPPCMSFMYGHLKSDKHLKYNGRLQFGLFLKSIGLPFNEAMLFWKRAFSKFSDDEFNKSYAYNVRHNYGLEGKRANYGCWNCKQIILGPQPAPSDHSGCPFKHQSSEQLVATLQSTYSLNELQLKEVVDIARSGHFQTACSRVLELHQPNSAALTEPVTTPTQFYEASLAQASKKM